jgi:hypothetical protein
MSSRRLHQPDSTAKRSGSREAAGGARRRPPANLGWVGGGQGQCRERPSGADYVIADLLQDLGDLLVGGGRHRVQDEGRSRTGTAEDTVEHQRVEMQCGRVRPYTGHATAGFGARSGSSFWASLREVARSRSATPTTRSFRRES